MRTLKQFLDDYGRSHRNPVNQLIHFICVPAIFFSSLGLAWLVPVGRWLGLEGDAAAWVNAATLFSVVAGLFYLRLSIGSFVAMTLWFAASVAGILAIESAGGALLWICAAIWVVAWGVQIVGHNIEGAKPSFADDVVFLLIGPLFVMHELRHRGAVHRAA